MSISLGSLVIAANTATSFQAPNDGVKAILIGNESGLTVTITMESGGVQKTLYPSLLDWFEVRRGFTGRIKVTPTVILSNVADFPSSSLVFDAIGLHDPEDSSMYPISLVRATNVGGTVTTNTTMQVINDTSALATNIVEATVQGETSSRVLLRNSGDLTLGNNAGASGTINVDGANALISLPNIGIDNNTGLTLVNSLPLKLTVGQITRISKFTAAVSTVSTFFNHGLGVIPDLVLCIPDGAAATTNRIVECEYSSLTSTQCKLTAGASFNIVGVAIAF